MFCFQDKYFSWGDTIGKNKNGTGSYSFSEANYKAGLCGSGNTLTGDLPQGYAKQDAATANVGYTWMIPTQTQVQEIINETNNTWTTKNGVNGWKFTSKKDSSKYIFLPAGGVWTNNQYKLSNQQGNYLTTKYSGTSNSSPIYFISTQIYYNVSIYRYTGMNVRAIQQIPFKVLI